MRRCLHIQYSDSLHCKTCGQNWDMNDSSIPNSDNCGYFKYRVTERVANWNAERYEQEYNHELTFDLLLEELNELNDAENEIDSLDALCDIIYVAMGAAWKMGLSADQVEQALFAVCDANDTKTAKKTDSKTKANIDKGVNFAPPERALAKILETRK